MELRQISKHVLARWAEALGEAELARRALQIENRNELAPEQRHAHRPASGRSRAPFGRARPPARARITRTDLGDLSTKHQRVGQAARRLARASDRARSLSRNTGSPCPCGRVGNFDADGERENTNRAPRDLLFAQETDPTAARSRTAAIQRPTRSVRCAIANNEPAMAPQR